MPPIAYSLEVWASGPGATVRGVRLALERLDLGPVKAWVAHPSGHIRGCLACYLPREKVEGQGLSRRVVDLLFALAEGPADAGVTISPVDVPASLLADAWRETA